MELMHWADWLILIASVVGLGLFGLYTTRYMKGVTDFLVAGRQGGRYMLSITMAVAGVGAISIIAMFEMYYKVGLPPVWWQILFMPVTLIILLSGWVYYRFRETRCLTMAQYFEVRYSRGVRILAGIIIYVSGVLNFGIFPAVAARFFVYFTGMPDSFALFGVTVPTFAPVMILCIGASLALALLGGQITVMLTDCVQGMIFCVAVCIVLGYVLYTFNWDSIVQTLSAAPGGASMLNPYDTAQAKDYNVWYFLIGIFGAFYGAQFWQGVSGYQGAATTPHEAKMAGVIGVFRAIPQALFMILLPIVIYMFFHHPDYAVDAEKVNAYLKTIENPIIAEQMRVSVGLAYLMPIGIKGLICVIIMYALLTTQDTYLHAWGTIFVQDIVLPWRGHLDRMTPIATQRAKNVIHAIMGLSVVLPIIGAAAGLYSGWLAAALLCCALTLEYIAWRVFVHRMKSPEEHIRVIRWSVFFVGLFAFFFSLLFWQSLDILMFFAVTGAIVAGLGALIAGGLYWKGNTSAGAYTALLLGAVLSLTRMGVQQLRSNYERCVANGAGVATWYDRISESVHNNTVVKAVFSINEQWFWFWMMVSCLLSTIVVSGIHGMVKTRGVNFRRGLKTSVQGVVIVGPILLLVLYLYNCSPQPDVDLVKWGWLCFVVAWVVGFCLDCGSDFDLNRMLHRGQYDVDHDHRAAKDSIKSKLWAYVGITKEYTLADRIIAMILVVWNAFWVILFIVGTALSMTGHLSDGWWPRYWKVYVWAMFLISVPTTIWYTIGGWFDIQRLFEALATKKRDHRDDGTVVGHHLLADEPVKTEDQTR